MTSPAKKLRSAIVKEGLDRAPHRAFLRAVGMADEDFAKPLVAIVSQHGENTPCSMSLGPQADAARLIASAIGQISLPRAVLVAAHGVVVLAEVGRRMAEIQDQAAAAQRLEQRGAGERLRWRLRGDRG